MLSLRSIALALVVSASPLQAQTSDRPTGFPATCGRGEVEVLILGTYHFANPGLDVVQTEVADVLAPEKQSEIEAIADALARFRPTRIAVEAPLSYATTLDSVYRAYRAGAHTLTRNESQQLGFRLAARFDHARVHPIDHDGEFPWGPLMQYAGEHEPATVAWIQTLMAEITEELNRQQRELGIADMLRWHNDPAIMRGAHGMYVRMNQVGAADTYVGADLVAAWYERNIRIYSNIQELAEPGERVLVIIGSGHVPILRELAGYDAQIELMDALEYLP